MSNVAMGNGVAYIHFQAPFILYVILHSFISLILILYSMHVIIINIVVNTLIPL